MRVFALFVCIALTGCMGPSLDIERERIWREKLYILELENKDLQAEIEAMQKEANRVKIATVKQEPDTEIIWLNVPGGGKLPLTFIKKDGKWIGPNGEYYDKKPSTWALRHYRP